MTLFVDSSAWYAAADDGDRSNGAARRVLASGEALVTSDHVLVETWLLLNRRLGWDASQRFWAALRSGVAVIEPVISIDLNIAWEIGEDFPDQGFSVVDRTCFAVMRRLGVFRAATFDHHFAIYRFGRQRSDAFEIVRA
ncbi:MAG: PIN domain-containing protein [Actinobacteria bacterium]|nr:PIN domain-containing protein [Actinomycetota bacterium]